MGWQLEGIMEHSPKIVRLILSLGPYLWYFMGDYASPGGKSLRGGLLSYYNTERCQIIPSCWGT